MTNQTQAPATVLIDATMIGGAMARQLVAEYGVLLTIVDGAYAQNIVADDIEDSDRFLVNVNYGHEVQLLLRGGEFRCEVVLERLHGQVVDHQWVALLPGESRMTEAQLYDMHWSVVDAECLDYIVEPAIEHENEEFGLMVERHATSEAYGFARLEGQAPDGKIVRVGLRWQSHGDCDGSYADLFDWVTPEINSTAPGCGIELESPIIVVDEDGDEMDKSEITNIIGITLSQKQDEWEQAAADTLPEPPDAEALDFDEESDMEQYVLTNDKGADVRLTGEHVARATSQTHLRDQTRWTELDLYRTAGGKWVCHQIGKTLWEGERDRHAVFVADTDAELIKALGYGWLAKELYDEANIDHAKVID